MSLSLEEIHEESSLTTRVIVAYYSDLYRRPETTIVRTLVEHFASNDRDFDESQIEIDDPESPSSRAEGILAFYAERYRRNTAKVLHAIVLQFVRTDKDFNPERFAESCQEPTALAEMRDAGIVFSEPAAPPVHAIPHCPVHDVIRSPAGEDEVQQELGEAYETKVASYRCPLGEGEVEAPALRGVHPKTYGVVESEFRILGTDEDSPIGLPVLDSQHRVGIFREEGDSYPAILRFSGGGGPGATVLSDHAQQAHGLAIKLLHEDGTTAQDYLLNNAPVFFTREPIQALPQEPKESSEGMARRMNEILALGDSSKQPLTMQQWSLSAYSWGLGRAVKYAVKPIHKVEDQLRKNAEPEYSRLLNSESPNYRRSALHFAVRNLDAPMELAFCVQFADPDHTESQGCPVDNETVLWRTPFFHLATIKISPQAPLETSTPSLAESLSFNPWHIAHESHLPLGKLNRARRWLYMRTAAARHEENKSEAPHSYEAPTSMTVAVVGGGAAGCAAALALADFGYTVTLFEKKTELGGHACHKKVFGDTHVNEPAFGAFRPRQWPNLVALLKRLQIETESHGQANHFMDSDFVGWFDEQGLPVERDERVIQAGQLLVAEFAKALKDPESDGVTVGECIEQLGLDSEFLATFFLGGVIHYFAGHPVEYYLAYPLRLLAWMWLNNAARGDEEGVELLRVDNRLYMEAFENLLQTKGVTIVKGVDVRVVKRESSSLYLSVNPRGGSPSEEIFGKTIFAVQAHHALTVLGPYATQNETDTLSHFAHTVDTVVVHRDRSWMPKDHESWKLFNIRLPKSGDSWPNATDTVPITINKLCGKDETAQVFATYDYAHALENRYVGEVERFSFEHGCVTVDTQRHRQKLEVLQGSESTYYCGSWTRGLTLHEDALVSGLEVANRILGPCRGYHVLSPPVPLPKPFEEWQPNGQHGKGGGWATREAALEDLRSMLATVSAPSEIGGLEEGQNIRGLGLSSLHLASWVSLINDRLPPHCESLGLASLFEIETVGELVDELMGNELLELEADLVGIQGDGLDSLALPMGAQRRGMTKLSPEELEEPYHPVGYAQESILLSHFLARSKAGDWNIPLGRWLHGPLSIKVLEQCFDIIAARHAALRTTFHSQPDGSFAQSISSVTEDNYFQCVSVSTVQQAEYHAKVVCREPMQIRDSCFRVRVYQVSPKEHLLVIVAHHAILDGWSVGIVLRELQELYGRMAQGEACTESSLPVPSFELVEFASWQREQYSEANHPDFAFWRKRFEFPLPSFELAPVTAQSPGSRALAHTAHVALGPATVADLKALSYALGTSHNVLLMTAYAIFLCRLSGESSLLVRLPHAARATGTETTVGCFADALVLRVDVCPRHSFVEAAKGVHTLFYSALEHPLPFVLLPSVLENGAESIPKLNRVVFNVEQGVSFVNLNQHLSPQITTSEFSLQLHENIDAGLVQSMLSLNEFPDGTMAGEWQISSAKLSLESALQLAKDFEAWVEKIVQHDGNVLAQELSMTGASPNQRGSASIPETTELAIKVCPFADIIRRPVRDARDLQLLQTSHDDIEPSEEEHALEIGCYRAVFTSLVDGPEGGVFSQAGDTFQSWIRLSRRFGAGALAIKVHDEEKTLHDFLFLSTKTIVNDPVKLVNAAGGNQELGAAHPLQQPYYSISAYSFGDGAAVKFRLSSKLSLQPEHALPKECLTDYFELEKQASTQADASGALMEFWLAHATQPLVLTLSVQFAEDPQWCPVDDTMVEWTTPFTPVAEIKIGQNPNQGAGAFPESLRFNPYHVSSKHHLPLGRLNRFRKDFYEYVNPSQNDTAYPYTPAPSLRVAVVGGGAAGLCAALALSEHGYAVTVFEKASKLGGHAASKSVFKGAHAREPAFGAFRKRQWPNLVALLDMLGVDCISHGSATNWFDSNFVGWFTPHGERIEQSEEVIAQAQKLIAEFTRALRDPNADDETVGDAIVRLGLSDEFLATWFLGGVIHYFAGHSLQYYLDYPLRLVAWMWLNNAERDEDDELELLTVNNDTYMARFRSFLESKGVQIETGTEPQVKERGSGGWSLSMSQNEKPKNFHRLVLAIQPHHALSVLGDFARPAEQAVLELFEHTVDTVVVHRDPQRMPKGAENKKLLNIHLPEPNSPWPSRDETVPITINKPCTKDGVTPIYATYDYAHAALGMHEGSVERFTFEHARVTPQIQRLRKSLALAQRGSDIAFCGSWTRGLTLHEDAIVSGFEAANRVMGGARQYRILQPPIELPEPFEKLPQKQADWAPLGESREEIAKELSAILAQVCEPLNDEPILEDTNLRGLGLSSLHFARLANAITARLPVELQDDLDIIDLLQVETLGELADYIVQLLYDSDDSEEVGEPVSETQDGLGPGVANSYSKAEAVRAASPEPKLAEPEPIENGRRNFLESLELSSEKPQSPWLAQLVQGGTLLTLFAALAVNLALALEVARCAWPLGGMWLAAPLGWLTYVLSYGAFAWGFKWAVVGRLRPGRYPINGLTHLRWWSANLILSIGQQFVFTGFHRTPFASAFFRALGARVHSGADLNLEAFNPTVSFIDADLLTIGDRAHLRPGALVQTHFFVDNTLVLAPVELGNRSILWTRAVIEPGSQIGTGSEVSPHSVVTLGGVVPDGKRAEGVPARCVGLSNADGDGVQVSGQTLSAGVVHVLLATVLLPLLLGLALEASFQFRVMENGASHMGYWLLSWPLFVFLSLSVCMLGGVFKKLSHGPIQPGTPVSQIERRFAVGQFFAGLYTQFSIFWTRDIRWVGRKIFGSRIDYGAWCDPMLVDPACGDLFEIPSGSLFSPVSAADFVELRTGDLVFQSIRVDAPAYVAAYATVCGPQHLGAQSVVANASYPSVNDAGAGDSVWVGAPAHCAPLGVWSSEPYEPPSRVQRFIVQVVELAAVYLGFLIFSLPTMGLWQIATASKGWIELAGAAFGLFVLGYVFLLAVFTALVWWQMAFCEPLAKVFNGSLALALSPHIKMLMLVIDPLAGSAVHRAILKRLGIRIGSNVYIDNGVAFSEPLVTLENGVMLNRGAALISHSRQPDGTDGMKPLKVGAGSTMGLWSYVVGGTELPEGVILGSLSRPFDGQLLQPHREYDNTPCRPRRIAPRE